MEQFSNGAFLKWSISQMEQFSNRTFLKWSNSQMEHFGVATLCHISRSQEQRNMACDVLNDETLIVYHHGETFKTFSHSDCWMYDNEIDVNIKHETIVYNTATS